MSPDVPFEIDLHGIEEIHDASNRFINVKLLIALTNKRIYGSILKDYFFIYYAIEESLESCRDEKRIFALRDQRVYRSSALYKDVTFFLGDRWMDKEGPSPTAKKYMSRIEYVRFSRPELLIAYAKTMFLASFSGGKTIRGIVKKTLGLRGDEGLAFFDYGEMNRRRLRAEYKEKLRSIDSELDCETKQKIIEETKLVLAMNNSIAAQVQITNSGISKLLKMLFITCFLLVAFLYTMKMSIRVASRIIGDAD